jgi:hypothetical protein
MFIELLAISHVLKGWLQTPDAPICEINSFCFPADERTRPYTKQEIDRMRGFLKRHAPNTYMRMFYGE